MMSLLDEVYKASKITAVRTGCYFILISFMFLTSRQNQVFCLMEKDEKKGGKGLLFDELSLQHMVFM